MKYSSPGLILLMFFFSTFSSYSQDNHPEHEHTVRDAGHTWHIGLGLSAAKMAGEQGMEPGIHVHLLRKLGNESNWSLGMGYEGLKGENWHSGLNALLNYRPLEFFSINAGPGIVFEKADAKNEVKPAFHTEGVFEFHVAGIHLGPMFGLGFDHEHTHFSVGIHIGFGM